MEPKLENSHSKSNSEPVSVIDGSENGNIESHHSSFAAEHTDANDNISVVDQPEIIDTQTSIDGEISEIFVGDRTGSSINDVSQEPPTEDGEMKQENSLVFDFIKSGSVKSGFESNASIDLVAHQNTISWVVTTPSSNSLAQKAIESNSSLSQPHPKKIITKINLDQETQNLSDIEELKSSGILSTDSNRSIGIDISGSLNASIEKDITPVFIAGCLLVVNESYKPVEITELELVEGDIIELEITPVSDQEFWLKGKNQSGGLRTGQVGFFSRDKVAIYDPDNEELSKKGTPVVSNLNLDHIRVEPVPKGTLVTAMFAFEPTKKDEFHLSAGSTILVQECPEGGWWKGITGMEDKNPTTGWFPASLVKVDQPIKMALEKFEISTTIPIEIPHRDRKQSWLKKIKSVQDHIIDDEIKNRERSLSHPNKEELIPGSILSPLGEVILHGKHKNAINYEAIPALGDELSVKESFILEPQNTRYRSSSTATNRATLLVSSPLNPFEIMQGALDETVQDKIPGSIFKLLSNDEKKRLSVIWELIQTERDYVRDLYITIEMFMKPMANLKSVGSKTMEALFANIEQIYSVNSDFLYHLLQIDDLKNINAYAEAFLLVV